MVMYKFDKNHQFGLADFNQPMGLKMNPENRWVKKAEKIPWEAIEEKYAALFPGKKGMPAKPLRTALGSLLIQKQLQFSDRELVEEIRENPYFQYFIGLPGYQDTIPFVPSLLVEFRKRLTAEVLEEIDLCDDLSKQLATIRTLVEQQQYMYENKVHSVPDRIVSISQPYIRPIARGKAKAPVEFGAKLDLSIDENGIARLERLSFDAYNESDVFITAVENYKSRTGHYPERVLVDQIYRNRTNRAFCSEHGIRISGPALGRPKKDNKVDKKQEYIIKVKNVSKVYKINKRKSGLFGAVLNLFAPRYEKKIAVSDMNFSIEEGEAVAFIGSNGAGKSTTIKMLSGILYPSEGEITVASYVPYKQRKKYVSNIGVVLGQKSQLVWDLPVRDGYELIRHIYKISKEDYEKRLDEFIEMLDMKEFINQPVRQLSLGQKMRAEIVATMLHNPKIIFLDEPTIGLDLVAKKKIQDFIRTINKKYNVTIIFTTHDMQDIVSTCERLIIIDKGKKIYDGAVKNVKELCDDVKILRVEMAQGEKVSNDGLLNIKECDENIVERIQL